MSIGVALVVKEEQLVRVLLRNLRREDGPTITVDAAQWREFLPAALAWDCETTLRVGGLRLMDTHMIGADEPVCICTDMLVHLHFGWDDWRYFVDRARQGCYDGPPVLTRAERSTLLRRIASGDYVSIGEMRDEEIASYVAVVLDANAADAVADEVPAAEVRAGRWRKVRVEVTNDEGRVTSWELEHGDDVPLTGKMSVWRDSVQRADDSGTYMITEPVGRARVSLRLDGALTSEAAK